MVSRRLHLPTTSKGSKKMKSESEVAQSCPTLMTPWTAAHQAPLSMGFSGQEYWSGVPLPSPECKDKFLEIELLGPRACVFKL